MTKSGSVHTLTILIAIWLLSCDMEMAFKTLIYRLIWIKVHCSAPCRHAVHHARQEADKKVYENIDPKSSEVYRLANQFRRENTDVVGDKPVKNDAGEMSMSEDSKQAWLEHYQRLLNVEFDWDPDHLSYQSPVEGPPIPITTDMVKKAISQMKAGKAPGPSGPIRHSGGDDKSGR